MACALRRAEFKAERPFLFVVYGDMPYGSSEEQVLAEDIAPKIRDREDLPFVIHVGDLGRPEKVCADAKLEEIKAFWATELRKPVFYTPGDNEWADCDRPVERLAAVRRIFFNQSMQLSSGWPYETQPDQPENALWWYGGVLFVTVHTVDTKTLATERDEANRLWLERAFALATEGNAAAVVVVMQADLFNPTKGAVDAFTRCQNRHAAFCEQILVRSAALDKPVLLVHGDTDAYCLDQPFPANRAPRLWRLNAPGDFAVHDAAVVSIHPTSLSRPFKVTGLVSGQAAPRERN